MSTDCKITVSEIIKILGPEFTNAICKRSLAKTAASLVFPHNFSFFSVSTRVDITVYQYRECFIFVNIQNLMLQCLLTLRK